jgi:hypothetical protein
MFTVTFQKMDKGWATRRFRNKAEALQFYHQVRVAELQHSGFFGTRIIFAK